CGGRSECIYPVCPRAHRGHAAWLCNRGIRAEEALVTEERGLARSRRRAMRLTQTCRKIRLDVQACLPARTFSLHCGRSLQNRAFWPRGFTVRSHTRRGGDRSTHFCGIHSWCSSTKVFFGRLRTLAGKTALEIRLARCCHLSSGIRRGRVGQG